MLFTCEFLISAGNAIIIIILLNIIIFNGIEFSHFYLFCLIVKFSFPEIIDLFGRCFMFRLYFFEQ